jgi:chemotaxis protein CheD
MTGRGDHIIYLTQGECRISADPAAQLSTVLGSCVAACIWDARARVGGMNHFLLPFAGTGDVGGSLRYGAHSMETLINGVLGQGGNRRNLQAKLFGGATMSANLGRIGAENARFAKDFLADEEIPCLAEDLGDCFARRVLFVPTTGQARVMKVRSTDVAAPAEVLEQIAERRKNDVVLF